MGVDMEYPDDASGAGHLKEVLLPKRSSPFGLEERARRTDPALLKSLLNSMLLIRCFEEKVAELFKKGKIGGFCHLYIGQEAVAVGSISTLTPDDYIFSSYRDHGHALARGVEPGEIMAELYGKQSGVSKGKGGSMHLFDRRQGCLGGYALVGGQIPLAVGAAFANRYLKQSRVTICFFGEAAVNGGPFHESLNLAALWELPVVFICENNRYGMGTPIERASALYDLSQKAFAYNMEHSLVDGMNVLAVREVVNEAVERARNESAPTLIEARTYRFMGHSMADPVHGHYRTEKEVEEQRRLDPIRLLTSALDTLAIMTIEKVEDERERVLDKVEDAIAFAERSLDPLSSDLLHDIYSP
jgi:pyruvate dehydrogenase E1 component subunit alpha